LILLSTKDYKFFFYYAYDLLTDYLTCDFLNLYSYTIFFFIFCDYNNFFFYIYLFFFYYLYF